MDRLVILVTGTPCVGKTTIAKQLTETFKALYINLTEFADSHDLVLRKDIQRGTAVVNERKMRSKLLQVIDNADKDTIIIDGHFAPSVVPKSYVNWIFVLRRSPVELRQFMEKCGFEGAKLWENLASEILDVCLVEALQGHEENRVCELDITGKAVPEVVAEICAILEKNKKCYVGCVDWLGFLEREGITDEYLKF
jgi:adenylate kinase